MLKGQRTVYRISRKRALACLCAGICMVLLIAAGALRARALLQVLAVDQQTGLEQQVQETDSYSVFLLKEQTNKSQQNSRVNGWLTIAHSQDVEIQTGQGVLHASVYDAIGTSEKTKWAIVLHDTNARGHDQVLDAVCELSLNGYRVLAPDMRACGKSEGVYTSLGIQEAADVSRWAQWIQSYDPAASIVMLGVGEGAAAALMALGCELPDNICAIAADSACASVKRRAEMILEERFEEISGLDWMLFSIAYRIALGTDISRGELSEYVSSADVPLLFIHGTGDQEVPAWHSEDLVHAAKENGSLLYIEGASHGMARFADPQLYYDTLFSFFESARNQ